MKLGAESLGLIKVDPVGPGLYARIYPDFKRCIGCRICEITCSLRRYGTINPEYSRIRVFPFKGIDVPVQCRMCADPKPCIMACPGSRLDDENPVLRINKNTGAVVVNIARCMEQDCDRECAKSCPAKAIFFHPEKGYALICDLCGGSPQCVKACPVGCLEYIAGPADYIPPERYAYPPEKIAKFLEYLLLYHDGKKMEDEDCDR